MSGSLERPPPIIERRPIRGASAVLLPFTEDGEIDWAGFESLLGETIDAGLIPAVNMDTGFGPFLSAGERSTVLRLTSSAGVEFIAGAHVDDAPGSAFDRRALLAAATECARHGALPILFPNHGLAGLSDDGLVEAHRSVAAEVDRLLAFELGGMFHPAGRIYSHEVFEALLGIQAVVGIKHSSLRRDLEWQRLGLRDRLRPEFLVMTGNDLAIDLVVHGSDYLLGLSAFAPAAFAARDRAWNAGELARFWELNDLLQYLGHFAFRPPVPGYRHDAALFLSGRGRIRSDRTHPESEERPQSDAAVLADISERLDRVLDDGRGIAGPAR